MRARRLILPVLLAAAACRGVPPPPAAPRVPALREVTSWVCQLQGLDRPGAVDRLARARAELAVIEPMVTVKGREGFPIRPVVTQIRVTPPEGFDRRLCLAYVNVGQAETYRTYWHDDWRAPTADAPGEPAFLLRPDPDGWAGNHVVAYWDPAWRAVMFGEATSLVDRAVAGGFDGVFLDWVLGYADDAVRAAAAREGVDPAAEMAALIRDLRNHARRTAPGFLVVAQNAAPLLRAAPWLADHVDGVTQESLSFHGSARAAWDDPAAADAPTPATGDWSTATLLDQLAGVAALGIPVFTLDYASTPENVERAERTSREHGFVPFVSRTPLDRLPDRVVRDGSEQFPPPATPRSADSMEADE